MPKLVLIEVRTLAGVFVCPAIPRGTIIGLVYATKEAGETELAWERYCEGLRLAQEGMRE